MTAWFDGGLGPRRMAGGHWIPAGAVVPALLGGQPSDQLLVGRSARLGPVKHAGRVTLSRAVEVHGDLDVGGDLVLGAGCTVLGAIRCGGRLVVQASRVAGPIEASGDVLLVGPSHVGAVHAGGDIVVVGRPKAGRLVPGGRVTTRPW